MGSNALVVSLPAIIALLFKGGIFAYARLSRTHNKQTRLYLYFLFALSLQNIAEIYGFHTLIDKGEIPHVEATAFYAASILVIALLFHLAVSLAFEGKDMSGLRPVLTAVYAYAAVLEVLLLFTDALIKEFVPFEYSVTRVPGPLYSVFEIYAIGVFLSVVGILVYGAIRQDTSKKRTKNSVLIVAIIPMILVVITVLTLLHFGVRWINASVTFPIAITYFLIVTAYAIHQHRLFDIQFYMPWSKVRKRKTAFYDRIRRMIAEIAELESVSEAIGKLADTFKCPVVLVGGGRGVVAATGASERMVEIPEDTLHKFEQIVVANEIADTNPETHALMKRRDVAAIVPFYPHSRHASGWLLLGDAFSEQVYTPLDFRLVEQLFDKMADLFLDKLLTMRAHLADARSQIHDLERRVQKAEMALAPLQVELDSLRQENIRLMQEQPTDSVDMAALESGDTLGATITLLGRDKAMLKRLREHFPQVAHFVGPDSVGFKRQRLPDVLVCRVEADTPAAHRKLARLFDENRVLTGVFLLYGSGAAAFASKHSRNLVGSLIEVLGADLTEAALARKVTAMAELHKAVRAVHNPDYPVMGRSRAFTELIVHAQRIAGFKEPVFIEGRDTFEVIELARYMHGYSGREGKFTVLAASELEKKTDSTALLTDAHDGTVMIDNLCHLSSALCDKFRTAIIQTEGVRLIAGCDDDGEETSEKIQQLAASSKPFILVMPTMRTRKDDIPLLVHYYTLQFNLQAGTQHYLSQRELEDVITQEFPADMTALKALVFSALQSKQRRPQEFPELDYAVTNKSLDEHVAEFEARLIAQTLERCDGNKSKAARLLGLRPNTLHYKIERYRLSSRRKR